MRWRRRDLQQRVAERFGVNLHKRSIGKILKRLGFSRVSVRPRHPKADSDAGAPVSGDPGSGCDASRCDHRGLAPVLQMDHQVTVSVGVMWHTLKQLNLTRKKSLRAAEQERPKVAAARSQWRDEQARLSLASLVFIDG